MVEIDQHLGMIRKRVVHSCNRMLLDYLESLPKRRIETIEFASLSSRSMLKGYLGVRKNLKSPRRKTMPRDELLAPFREGARQSTHKFDFIVFVGTNPAHRQYLPINAATRRQPSFTSDAAMLEFYKYFDGLDECSPSGNGFVRWDQIMTLGEMGGFGSTIMKSPPSVLRRHPIVFRARNGDCVFQSSKGLRWYGWRRGALKDVGGSFSDFLAGYIEYRKIGDALPFDSYGRQRKRADREIEMQLSAMDAAFFDRRFPPPRPT